ARERNTFAGGACCLRDGPDSEILSAGHCITRGECCRFARIDRVSRIDSRAKLCVGKSSTAVWIDTSGERGAVYVCRRTVDRVMILKTNAVASERIHSRRMPLRHKIWPHAVPNNEDDTMRV